MLLINRTFKITPGIEINGGFRVEGYGPQPTPQIPKMKFEFEQEPTTVLNLIHLRFYYYGKCYNIILIYILDIV